MSASDKGHEIKKNNFCGERKGIFCDFNHETKYEKTPI